MRLLLLPVLTLTVFIPNRMAVAQEVDAGAPKISVSEPVVVVAPAAPLDLDNPLGSMKGFYAAVKSGQGWLAAMILLFIVVGLVRMFGKKVHTYLNQFSAGVWFYLNKPFWFLFDTKMGGWLINWLTAIAGALGTAQMAGAPVDAKTWQVALMSSTGATVLIELYKDITEWWNARKAKAAIPPVVAPIPDPDNTPVP